MRAWIIIFLMLGVTGVYAEPELLISDERPRPSSIGISVAMDGDLILSGAPGTFEHQGSGRWTNVLPFRYDGVSWQSLSHVFAPEREPMHGWSLDIDGQLAVVGSPHHGTPASLNPLTHPDVDLPGKVSVLRFDGSEWRIIATMHPGAMFPGDESFGIQVAVSGTTIAVRSRAGVEIYEHEALSDTWVLQNTISSSGSISLFEDKIAIGNSSVNSRDGEVYIFERTATGEPGGTWIQTATLTSTDDQVGGRFGSAVDLFGNTLIVGARGHRGPPPIPELGRHSRRPGQVYTLEYNSTADAWVTTSKQFPIDPSVQAYGASVAIEGDTFVVGAPSWGEDEFTSQLADVYRRPRSSPDLMTGDWSKVFEARPSPRTRQRSYNGVAFGHAVAISGDCIAVGDPGARVMGENTDGVVSVFCDIPTVSEYSRAAITIICCEVPIDPMGPVVFEIALAQYLAKINKRRIQVKLTTPHGKEAVLFDEWRESGGNDDPAFIKGEVSGNLLEAYGQYQLTVIATDEYGRSQLRHQFFQIGDVVMKE